MKKTLLIGLISLMGSGAISQQYNTAIGIKGDWSTLDVDMAQFTIKHFFSEPNAFEINIGAGRRYGWLEGLYLYNQPLAGEFNWYTGGGLDFGYWNTNYDNRYDPETRSGFWGGATALLGVEYTFSVIPLNFALDAGPTFRVVPGIDVGVKVGFATRYAFGARRTGRM